MKKFFLLMIGLFIFSLGIFAAVPHSYVTENPSKEVTQTETLKRKDKAELNLTITKKNSKEAKVERAFYNTSTGLFYIAINGKEYNIAPDDNLLISNKLEELPNLSTTNGRRKINKMFNTREVNYKMESNGNWRNIKTTFEELPKEVYINVLDKNYNLKDVLNLKDIKITKVSDEIKETEVYATILEGYSGKFYNGNVRGDGFILPYGSNNNYIYYDRAKVLKWDTVGTSLKDQIFMLVEDNNPEFGAYILKEFGINSKIEFYDLITYPKKTYNINNNLIIETINNRRYSSGDNNYYNELWLKFIKFPQEDFSFSIKEKKCLFNSWYETNEKTYYFTYKRASTDGESNLNIDSSYNNEYIKYNSCTMENLQPVALLSPVQGVSINQVWGDGLLELAANDKLTINGVQHTLSYSGLSEQRTNLNGIDLSYQIVNNKLQLKINGYEPGITTSQPFDIEVEREIREQGTTFTRKVLKHRINIIVPNIQTLSGNSTLTFGENYPVNTYVNFSANSSLNDTNPLQLENSIQDVVFNTTGNGILQTKFGDRLSVNGTEATVGNNNNIVPQKLKIGTLDYTYKVEDGKFRLALNDWGVLESDRNIEVKVIRDNKVVSTHNFTVKAPKKVTGSSNLEVNKQYIAGSIIKFQGISLSAPTKGGIEPPTPIGVTYKTNEGYGIPLMQEGDTLEINDEITRTVKILNILANGTLNTQTIKMTTSEIDVSVQSGKLRMALNKWFSDDPINLHLILKRGTNIIMKHNLTINVPSIPKVEGISNLTIDNTYKNEYIKFNSCTLDNLQPISLIGYFQGVTLSSLSGNGLLALEQGDILSVNGQSHTINYGNLAEQSLVLNGINLSYKVENGKLQLRINNYDMGVTSAQQLTFKVTRNSNEIMSHTMNVIVPNVQKLVGQSSLIISKEYGNEYIPFTSCTLENQQNIGLEKLVTGATLQQITGKGLLTLENGDTFTINGQQHNLISNSLTEQSLTLNGINLSYKVENGKLQLRINSYNLGITQAQPLTLKVNRSGKEVMNHTMNIIVPNIQKIVGESDLTIDDTYKNNYMIIKGCTLENPQNISFVNSVIGAEINQFSGKGLLKFEQGDILEVNGVQSVVNSNGGVIERNINLSGINSYYKAENGNFQIRIDDYKIGQESPQILNMKLLRDGKEIMTHKMKIFVPKITIDNSKTNVKIRDEYKEETFNIESLPYNVKGIEYLSGNDKIKVYTPRNYRSSMPSYYFNYLKINGVTVAERKDKTINAKTLNLNGVTVEVKENRDLIIALKNYERKISKPFELVIESSSTKVTPRHDYGGSNSEHNSGGGPDIRENRIRKQNIVFYYVPSKVVGNSTLEVKEYYPTPEYIEFNSCTTPAPAPIELENSLRDVKVIQNSGNGLVNLEQGDILELNGKQYTITTGGTLLEQQDTLGNINFKFKVENGKLRLALKSWGVFEPDRLLTINAKRENNPIMEHKMIIKAPRRVEGTSTLTFNEKYQIRDIIKFKGISLSAPTKGGIEPPTPIGVKFRVDDGYGIPFMQEGDILEIQNNQTRGIQKYIIDSKNSLKQQIIDLPGTNLSLFVTDGKVRLGLNNWLVNKNTVLNFKIIRGVNEISNTSITLEVPKAPFDILKNGILDFGKLIQGSKNKKAETSILLEMHQDISNVKFSLSTTTPELVNSNGVTLHARDLQAGVYKQGNKRHLVRIIGRIDVPEKQELGVYRGSVLLNVKIK